MNERSPIDLLVSAAEVATVDPALGRLRDGAVAIRGGRIVAVLPRAQALERFAPAEVRHHPHGLLVPGLVDVHVHPGLFFLSRLAPAAARGRPGLLARGGEIERFLNLLTQGVKLNEAQSYAAASASLLRALLSGVTYFNDAAGGETAALAQAARDTGLPGIVTYDFGADLAYDLGQNPPAPQRSAPAEAVLARAEACVRAHHRPEEGVACWYNILCDLTASDALYLGTTSLARRDGVGINSHSSTVLHHEPVSLRWFGKTSVRRLLDLGVPGPDWIGAHMGFIDEADLPELAASGAHVAHCPGTSMGAGKGIVARRGIPALLAAGVNVALGTDSAQWPDLPGQMALAFYAHKEALMDDSVLLADQVLQMATLAGAAACGQAAERGSLSVGKRADLVVVDCDNARFAAFADPLLAWLRVGSAADLREVYLGGKLRVQAGEALGLDAPAVVRRALAAAQELVLRRGA